MRIFKNKWFVRFARKERITDAKLAEAVRNAEKGLIDEDLKKFTDSGEMTEVEYED